MNAVTDNIVHRVLHQAHVRPATPAYVAMRQGTWQTTDWRTYVQEIRSAAKSMIALGMQRGQRVAILGFNRPEWTIVDIAAMAAGGAPAGIYTTCSASEVQYIVAHSEAPIVVVENAAQLAKVVAVRNQLPQLQHIVLMQGAENAAVPSDNIWSWQQFIAKGADANNDELDRRINAIEQAELATLIYTSGTTGPPKAVMLSHGNLAWTASTLVDIQGGLANDVLLSYLPLSHIAEQMASIHVPATIGATVYFAESLEKIPDGLRAARPTLFFGVPRIWEKFHDVMQKKLSEVTGAKKHLLAWARNVASKVHRLQNAGRPVPRALQLQFQLANKLVLRKIKAALGFDRVRQCITGAAPIAREILEFFASIDIPILEVYGQSEDSGPTTLNLPGRTKLGTVGVPIPGLQIKIADDGEVLVKGPNVFMGYLKDQAATAEILQDGWMASGDLGAFDRDGFLSITGRKKEIIITAGGKNITPKNIEAEIQRCPHVADAVIIGDRRKFLTVLLTLKPESVAKFGAAGLRDDIQAAIDAANAQLARVEQVKKFTVLPDAFSTETGEYTPTMKLRRSVIAKKYAAQIDAMYAGAE
jgi:long-chain acyl-CoA synthetase